MYTKVSGYPRLPNRRQLFGRLQGASRDDRIGMVKLMITYEYLICHVFMSICLSVCLYILTPPFVQAMCVCVCMHVSTYAGRYVGM